VWKGYVPFRKSGHNYDILAFYFLSRHSQFISVNIQVKYSSDLRYISIPQYIDTVNKYRDTILHLEYRDTQNTLIEQSVIVLLEKMQWSLFTNPDILHYITLHEFIKVMIGYAS